jgi:hypothetical protein
MTFPAILFAIEGGLMARRKPADTVQLKLRFPEKLRRRIEAAAAKNQQSMNLEIVERLDRSFQHEDEAKRGREIAQDAVAELVRLFGRADPAEAEATWNWMMGRMREEKS